MYTSKIIHQQYFIIRQGKKSINLLWSKYSFSQKLYNINWKRIKTLENFKCRRITCYPLIFTTHEVLIAGRRFSLFVTDLINDNTRYWDMWRLNIVYQTWQKLNMIYYLYVVCPAEPKSLFWFRITLFQKIVSLTVLHAALVLFHTFIGGKGSLKSIDI